MEIIFYWCHGIYEFYGSVSWWEPIFMNPSSLIPKLAYRLMFYLCHLSLCLSHEVREFMYFMYSLRGFHYGHDVTRCYVCSLLCLWCVCVYGFLCGDLMSLCYCHVTMLESGVFMCLRLSCACMFLCISLSVGMAMSRVSWCYLCLSINEKGTDLIKPILSILCLCIGLLYKFDVYLRSPFFFCFLSLFFLFFVCLLVGVILRFGFFCLSI